MKHMPLRATKTAESKTDRDEVAQIRTMLGDHTAHNRADCIAIGEHVYRHLERKGIKRGTLDLYVRKHFELRARAVYATIGGVGSQ